MGRHDVGSLPLEGIDRLSPIKKLSQDSEDQLESKADKIALQMSVPPRM